MKYILFILMIFIFVSGGYARECDPTPATIVASEFRILSKEPAYTLCLADQFGKDDGPHQFFHDGCFIKLEPTKKIKGIKKTSTSSGELTIYEKGEFCNKPIGAVVSKKLKNISYDCCRLDTMNPGKPTNQCTRGPNSKLLKEPDEQFIRCSALGSKWMELK